MCVNLSLPSITFSVWYSLLKHSINDRIQNEGLFLQRM